MGRGGESRERGGREEVSRGGRVEKGGGEGRGEEEWGE